MEKKLFYGAAYYPELWDEDTIIKDIEAMKQIGINCVRMGEFAWSRMEPDEDKIDLTFFHQLIDRLYDHGISVIMCTPTPTPPIWMTHNHPERLYVDAGGKRLIHGARQHVCTNHDYFIGRAGIIAEAIGKSLGKHPGIIGWQIDNEFKCHVAECMCETCLEKWHIWLETKYKTIYALNNAWGANVWSEAYQDFSQVPQPLPAPFLHNASLSLAYKQFSFEKIADFCDMQVNILKKYTDKPITTNINRYFGLDLDRLFEHLDFAAFDDYPSDDRYGDMIFNYDLMRKIKDKPFFVMETSPSHNGCLNLIQKPHQNGFLTAEVISAFASGANGFLYWLWRQQRAGCEQPHGAVLSSWGGKGLGYGNVVDAKKELDKNETILLDSRVKQAEIAITYSDLAKAMLSIEPVKGYDYLTLIASFQESILGQGYSRDFVMESTPLDGYKILFTPFAPALTDEYIAKSIEFVKVGGTWVIGPMTGYRTVGHTVPVNSGIGTLSKYLPINIECHYPLEGTGTKGIYAGVECDLCGYSAFFDPCESMTGQVTEGPSEGSGFIYEKEHGKGKIIFLGALPCGENGRLVFNALTKSITESQNITKPPLCGKGNVAIERVDNATQKDIVYVVNMNGKGGTVCLKGGYVDMMSGQALGEGELYVEPYHYRVLLEK